jgi:MFS family permease
MDATTLTPRSTGSYASALVRYVLAGTLARSADAGAIVGVVLLAADPPTGSPLGTSVGGLLAAALTAPHLLGPVAGRRLDAARDARRLLAAACLAYAGCLLLGALAVGRAPLVVPVILLALAGLTGPLLTGGLSSQLARMLPADDGVQRRAQGWDAVSYGIAGTAGPAAVAAVGTVVGPLGAITALAATAVVGGLLTLVLPRPVSSTADREAVGIGQALRLLGSRGPLRRVTGATCAASLAMATLPVVAVVLAPQVGGGTAAGATLAAAFGVGNLAGSALMTAVPLRAEPERATLR